MLNLPMAGRRALWDKFRRQGRTPAQTPQFAKPHSEALAQLSTFCQNRRQGHTAPPPLSRRSNRLRTALLQSMLVAIALVALAVNLTGTLLALSSRSDSCGESAKSLQAVPAGVTSPTIAMNRTASYDSTSAHTSGSLSSEFQYDGTLSSRIQGTNADFYDNYSSSEYSSVESLKGYQRGQIEHHLGTRGKLTEKSTSHVRSLGNGNFNAYFGSETSSENSSAEQWESRMVSLYKSNSQSSHSSERSSDSGVLQRFVPRPGLRKTCDDEMLGMQFYGSVNTQTTSFCAPHLRLPECNGKECRFCQSRILGTFSQQQVPSFHDRQLE